MKTEELLYLDCRDPESMKMLQKALKKIGPLAKCEDENVPLELIERAIDAMCRKYKITTQYIMFSRQAGEVSTYTVSIRRDDDYSYAGSVYGKTVYELFVKTAIKLFAEVKMKNVPLRSDKEEGA